MPNQTVPLPARIANGTPRGERTTVNARRPLTRSEMVAQSTARAGRLLSEGYRVTRSEVADTYLVHKPGVSTPYVVDVAFRACSCPRGSELGTCSHMILCDRIAELHAVHPVHPEPDWFCINCPECHGPAWVRGARVGGGNYITLSVCPCGCDSQRIDARVVWGREVAS